MGSTGYAAAGVAGHAASRGTGPAAWVQASYEDFRAGDPVSVSLDSGGDIRLAPALEMIGDTREAFIWALEEAADGSVYAAAGTEGRIYRFPAAAADRTPELFFEAGGTVHAMAVGPDGNLYAASSPGGKIWRLPLLGDAPPSEPWFATETRYVWALAFAPDGTLYAGTGENGLIYRITAGGEGEVLYDSNETHITALAVDDQGRLLAGSADNGHLYRIGAEGDVFVLFDAPMKQITGIVPTGEGLYLAAMEQASEGGASTAGAGAASSGSGAASSGGAGGGGSAGAASGAVYIVHDDGLVERLWQSDEEAVHALEAGAPGVIVGTGPHGRLLRVGPGAETTLLQRVEAAQITALSGRGRDLLVGSSNLGRVYRLASTYRERGEYLSQVKDTATTSRWGRIRWRGSLPEGTAIRLFTRSGNTADPDDTWSRWSGPHTEAAGSAIDSPPARFIQWKAELSSARPASSPALQWVELVYVQRNLRPVIDQLTVHPTGVVYRQNSSFDEGLPIGELPPSIERELARQQGRDSTPITGSASGFLGRAYFLPGSRTFTWEASDPNGDRLRYTLMYRGEGETIWKPVVTEIQERLYAWDTETVPDGLYEIRLLAADSASNPAGEEMVGERVGAPFVIDNTAPEIAGLDAMVEGGSAHVTGVGRDATSLIQAMEYAVDGAAWHAVLPADGLADAGEESIDIVVPLPPGEHAIVVRVTDAALNAGTGKVVVTIR